MPTVFIARRDAAQALLVQAQIQAARDWRVLGSAHSQYRTRAALAGSAADADALLIDLRLEDGAALTLVHELRERRGERPKVMVVASDASDALLFATMQAGADAYLLDSELPVVASLLGRMLAGEATMAPPIARHALQFFGVLPEAPINIPASNDRALDWLSNSSNPMELSPGERRLLQLLAQGMKSSEVAARMAISLEAVGRRIGRLYRKLSWDLRSGSLALMAA